MADISSIVGIVLMVIGGLFVLSGLILCYTTKGEYYNQEEVQAMVAAEMLEAERKKKAEAEAMEAALQEEMEESGEISRAGSAVPGTEGIGEPEMGNAPPSAHRKKRRGPLIAN